MYDKSYWSDHYMMHDQDDEDEEEGDDAFNNSNSDSGEQDDREESFFESEPWPFYREGGADDKPKPEDTTSLGGLLRLLLLKKDPDLPFAGNKELFSANPKLQVDGVGSILLPLDADQAQKLRKEYDASTNSEEQKQVWEIDGEYVKFEKPPWWKALAALTEVAARHLWLERINEDHDEMFEEPSHKLVVYGKDGLPCQTSDSSAEAVVIVPFSSSDGGFVVVEGSGASKTRYKLQELKFLVISGKVNYRIEGATSGNHTLLVCSLHLEKSFRFLSIHARDQDVVEIFSLAMKNTDEIEPVALLLHGEYKGEELGNSGGSGL